MTINIEELIQELSQPINPDKPWRTARKIARRLGLEQSCAIKIEEGLLEYYKEALTKYEKTSNIAHLP